MNTAYSQMQQQTIRNNYIMMTQQQSNNSPTNQQYEGDVFGLLSVLGFMFVFSLVMFLVALKTAKLVERFI
jgi:hypothetical protein